MHVLSVAPHHKIIRMVDTRCTLHIVSHTGCQVEEDEEFNEVLRHLQGVDAVDPEV